MSDPGDQQRLFHYEGEILRLQERVKLLQDENDRMRACLKYLDKQGGLGLAIHDRITKALTRYS